MTPCLKRDAPAGRKWCCTTLHMATQARSAAMGGATSPVWLHGRTPDLYDGEVFSDRMDAVRKIQELGFDGLLARSQAAVSHLRNDLVYAGFSMEERARTASATRPRARSDPDARAAAHSRSRLDEVAGDSARAGAFCGQGPCRNEKVIEALAERVRARDATFEQHIYAAPGHLFADPDMPAYDAAAADVSACWNFWGADSARRTSSVALPPEDFSPKIPRNLFARRQLW